MWLISYSERFTKQDLDKNIIVFPLASGNHVREWISNNKARGMWFFAFPSCTSISCSLKWKKNTSEPWVLYLGLTWTYWWITVFENIYLASMLWRFHTTSGGGGCDVLPYDMPRNNEKWHRAIKNHGIVLLEKVSPTSMSLIIDYCQFHQVPGRSNKVCSIVFKVLLKL
jgi:hypothetical protein